MQRTYILSPLCIFLLSYSSAAIYSKEIVNTRFRLNANIITRSKSAERLMQNYTFRDQMQKRTQKSAKN